eukprot:CAMPEP_0201583258 /NCGR_PEP_ID=MMETSP0190_2-20130828/96471_1 /ASSEMBLY_ACC=CAM_ASM_000263 /TAXON_ID=37353 /ORGANISM="Rosalina sp." /LENGTH=182 /DNA_ID=CAMNT_0048024835 /DNA_START=1 /DNA_END=549 /DNA_ORIENTATION=-
MDSQQDLVNNGTSSYEMLKDNSSVATLSSNNDSQLNVTIQNRTRSKSGHKAANTMEHLIMLDDPLGKSKQTIRGSAPPKLDPEDMIDNDTMLNRSQSDTIDPDQDLNNNDDEPLLKMASNITNMSELGKEKTQSYQLSDGQIDDLMVTVDNIDEFKKMKSTDKQRSGGQLDYQTSDEASTRL